MGLRTDKKDTREHEFCSLVYTTVLASKVVPIVIETYHGKFVKALCYLIRKSVKRFVEGLISVSRIKRETFKRGEPIVLLSVSAIKRKAVFALYFRRKPLSSNVVLLISKSEEQSVAKSLPEEIQCTGQMIIA